MIQLRGEVPVYVRDVRVQSSEMLMHDCQFSLQHVVLFDSLATVIRVALQACDGFRERALMQLGSFNMVDG